MTAHCGRGTNRENYFGWACPITKKTALIVLGEEIRGGYILNVGKAE
jgi:hypothetical protein